MSLKKFLATFFCLFFPLNLIAQHMECAELLRTRNSALIAYSIIVPVIGWLTGMVYEERIREELKDAKIMDAATTILTAAQESSSKVSHAYNIIDRFHKELITMYPHMTLSKSNVIDIAHYINKNGVENGLCFWLRYNALGRIFFPDMKALKYFNFSSTGLYWLGMMH